jgi:spermidine/putrescine transport system permease protein
VIAPEIVTGVSLLAFFSLTFSAVNDAFQLTGDRAVRSGLVTITLAHVAFNIAFVSVVVRTSLKAFRRSLEDAAQDLGANEWVTFRRVTLPLIMPGIVAGALLAFTLSLDNFVITFFVTGPGATTLPIEVFGRIRRAISPEINAISTIMLVISSVLVLASQILQRRRK